MRYYEMNDGEYILAYGRGGHGGIDITEERYNAILSAVEAMPQATDTVSYRIKTDLSYEPVEVEPVEEDIDDTEALNIIIGGEE